ncbi:unnamed protein product [Trichogramma brassicae]|uniref:Uncharacterized protein n=1 Tax=Trichogramma brassicae TaxID=86971 RepID=A0A6H5III5_9HYME|nr:unnamed protein product [Trichogramma brassicae]
MAKISKKRTMSEVKSEEKKVEMKKTPVDEGSPVKKQKLQKQAETKVEQVNKKQKKNKNKPNASTGNGEAKAPLMQKKNQTAEAVKKVDALKVETPKVESTPAPKKTTENGSAGNVQNKSPGKKNKNKNKKKPALTNATTDSADASMTEEEKPAAKQNNNKDAVNAKKPEQDKPAAKQNNTKKM